MFAIMTNQQRTQRITAYSCLATSLLSLVAVLVIPGCGQSPNSLQSLLGKAVQHQQDGEYESAINALTVCLKKYPNCTEARYLRGTCHAATNNLEAARTDLSAVTIAKPNWDRGWWALGTVYRASGNKTLSLEAFQKSLALNDQAADVNFELGRLLEEGGDREQALVHFRQAVATNPAHFDAQYRSGCLQVSSSPEAAIKALSEAVRIERKNGNAWLQRGLAFEQAEQNNRALADLSVACRLLPENADSWYHRGRILRKLDRPENAQECLAKAVSLDGSNDAYKRQLAATERDLIGEQPVIEEEEVVFTEIVDTSSGIPAQTISLPREVETPAESVESEMPTALTLPEISETPVEEAVTSEGTAAEPLFAEIVEDSEPKAKDEEVGIALFPIESMDEEPAIESPEDPAPQVETTSENPFAELTTEPSGTDSEEHPPFLELPAEFAFDDAVEATQAPADAEPVLLTPADELLDLSELPVARAVPEANDLPIHMPEEDNRSHS